MNVSPRAALESNTPSPPRRTSAPRRRKHACAARLSTAYVELHRAPRLPQAPLRWQSVATAASSLAWVCVVTRLTRTSGGRFSCICPTALISPCRFLSSYSWTSVPRSPHLSMGLFLPFPNFPLFLSFYSTLFHVNPPLLGIRAA